MAGGSNTTGLRDFPSFVLNHLEDYKNIFPKGKKPISVSISPDSPDKVVVKLIFNTVLINEKLITGLVTHLQDRVNETTQGIIELRAIKITKSQEWVMTDEVPAIQRASWTQVGELSEPKTGNNAFRLVLKILRSKL